MGIIDFAIIGIIVFSGLFALYRGLVRELLGLVSWVLAVLCGFFGMFLCRPFSTKFISNPQIADAVSAVIIAIIVLVVCTLITARINKGLRKSVLSSLDRTLGFIFGLLRGFIVVIGIYFFCIFALSPHTMEYYTKKNFLLPYLTQIQPYIENMMPKNWLKGVQESAREQDLEKVLESIEIKEKPMLKADEIKEETSYDEKDIESIDSLIEGLQ